MFAIFRAFVINVQEAIQNIDAEIIVVDNNSDDDSCQMIRVVPNNETH
jgi:glycosyltransferase involved in cell wall biosynthesis